MLLLFLSFFSSSETCSETLELEKWPKTYRFQLKENNILCISSNTLNTAIYIEQSSNTFINAYTPSVENHSNNTYASNHPYYIYFANKTGKVTVKAIRNTIFVFSSVSFPESCSTKLISTKKFGNFRLSAGDYKPKPSLNEHNSTICFYHFSHTRSRIEYNLDISKEDQLKFVSSEDDINDIKAIQGTIFQDSQFLLIWTINEPMNESKSIKVHISSSERTNKLFNKPIELESLYYRGHGDNDDDDDDDDDKNNKIITIAVLVCASFLVTLMVIIFISCCMKHCHRRKHPAYRETNKDYLYYEENHNPKPFTMNKKPLIANDKTEPINPYSRQYEYTMPVMPQSNLYNPYIEVLP